MEFLGERILHVCQRRALRLLSGDGGRHCQKGCEEQACFHGKSPLRVDVTGRNYLASRNGTVEFGSIVVGNLPSQRSALVRSTRAGLEPSAAARALIASASASPCILVA